MNDEAVVPTAPSSVSCSRRALTTPREEHLGRRENHDDADVDQESSHGNTPEEIDVYADCDDDHDEQMENGDGSFSNGVNLSRSVLTPGVAKGRNVACRCFTADDRTVSRVLHGHLGHCVDPAY